MSRRGRRSHACASLCAQHGDEMSELSTVTAAVGAACGNVRARTGAHAPLPQGHLPLRGRGEPAPAWQPVPAPAWQPVRAPSPACGQSEQLARGPQPREAHAGVRSDDHRGSGTRGSARATRPTQSPPAGVERVPDPHERIRVRCHSYEVSSRSRSTPSRVGCRSRSPRCPSRRAQAYPVTAYLPCPPLTTVRGADATRVRRSARRARWAGRPPWAGRPRATRARADG